VTGRQRVGRIAGWGAAGAIAIGLAGQAGRFSDRADAINFAAPAWLLAGAGAAVLMLVTAHGRRRRLRACAALGVLGAIAATLLAPDRLFDGGGDCPGEDLTLVQFNVFKNNRDVRPAVAWIRSTHADVVTLEEAASQLPILGLLRDDYPYRVSCVADMRCSTVILSRRPFGAAGGLARSDPENRAGLSAAWATLPSRSGAFTIVAAHLSHPWPGQAHPAERADLAAFVGGQESATTLVVGDMNLPASSFQIRQLAQGLGLRRAQVPRSWPATYAMPFLAIDHILLGDRWRVMSLVRGPALGSDHYPLLAHLRLRSETCSRA
jgi:endonuclease/exonuclease/phosphatase (EEP) superfamily protein YafD